MVRIPKKDEEGEPIRMNPDSPAGIYVTASVEYEYHMIAQNQKMQEEEKKIISKVTALKKSARNTKHGSSFVKLLEATAKLHRDMKTSEDPADQLLQVLLSLYTETIKDAFYNLSGKIGGLSDQKKRTVASDIVRKWGQSILGSRACVL